MGAMTIYLISHHECHKWIKLVKLNKYQSEKNKLFKEIFVSMNSDILVHLIEVITIKTNYPKAKLVKP